MKTLALIPLLGFAAAASAQTTPPAQETPKPRPALKLNLDEVEPVRPRITFGNDEKKDKKDDGANNLPGLGGRPSKDWVEPSKSVFPPNTGGAEAPVK